MATNNGKEGSRAGATDERPLCKYGAECYQKNPFHTARFKHQRPKVPPAESINGDSTVIPSTPDQDDDDDEKKLTMIKKKEIDEDGDGISSRIKRKSADKMSSSLAPTKRPKHHDLSMNDAMLVIKQKYLMDMPEDFYKFWQFCKMMKSDRPEEALKESLNLVLVGPYDILSGYISPENDDDIDYCCHWRFKYDPPEFQTLAVQTGDRQFHIGYHRDDPTQPPVFVAANSAAHSYVFQSYGGNMFSAVYNLLLWKAKRVQEQGADMEMSSLLNSLLEKLRCWISENQINMATKTKEMKRREKKVVAETFHTAGIVVPVCNDVGYREIPFPNFKFKKMLDTLHNPSSSEEAKDKLLDKIEEAITYVQFANDECDYGMGLELGMDLFSYGSEKLHPFIKNLLPMAYRLLKRPLYEKIIVAHLENRNKIQIGRALL